VNKSDREAGNPSAAEMAQLVLRVERNVTARLATILEAEQCSVERWQALTLLSDGEGHAMSELIAHTLLPPATVTRLVDGLIGSNLAYRRVDERDRRRVLVFATHRGHALHDDLSVRIEEQRDELFLVDDELRGLAQVVAAMNA
jgi:DNA-binding MarR family transcriptional regulator